MILSIVVLSVAALFADGQRVLAQSQNQSAPDLSGTWELVEDSLTGKLKPTDTDFPRVTVVIAQEGLQIRITETRIRRGTQTVREYSYYTDGRGETNLGRVELWPRYVPKFDSASGWKKGRLLVKYGTEGNSASSTDRKDEWRLGSHDGTLILTISTLFRVSSFSVGSQSETRERSPTLEKRKLVFSRR